MKPGNVVWVRRDTMLYSGTLTDIEGEYALILSSDCEGIHIAHQREIFPTKQEAVQSLRDWMTTSTIGNRDIRLLAERIK